MADVDRNRLWSPSLGGRSGVTILLIVIVGRRRLLGFSCRELSPGEPRGVFFFPREGENESCGEFFSPPRGEALPFFRGGRGPLLIVCGGGPPKIFLRISSPPFG